MPDCAVILDFDGLMVDSEAVEFQAWQEVYESEGAHLTMADWLAAVGYVDGFNPRAHLELLTGRGCDWKMIDPKRVERTQRLFAELTEPLPGVIALMDQAERLGFGLGLASNSTRDWVIDGLDRLGVRSRFASIRTREDVDRPKPAPDVYQRVLADLGTPASGSFAFEDSEPGVKSAKAAGLVAVAVPNALTAGQDLSAADCRVQTLAGFDLQSFAGSAANL